MKEFKAVVFDMDGVIFDSERLCLDCWKKIAAENGLENIEDAFRRCIGTSVVETRKILKDYYGEGFDYDRFMKQSSVMFHEAEEKSGLPVMKGVKEILDALADMRRKDPEIKLGLASSTRLATVTRQLKTGGFYDYFDEVIGGDQLEKSKPEPDIYLMACEKLGVRPQDAYAIEDSFNGIRAAYAAGMHPVMVPDMIAPDDEMKQKSEYIAKDLIEAMNYLCGYCPVPSKDYLPY